MKNTIKAALAVLMIMSVVAVMLPAFANKPSSTGNPYPPAIDNVTGSVTGRVTTAGNATQGIGGAYIAIVNASNTSQEYFNTTSNSEGYYAFTDVNATFNYTAGYGYDSTGANVPGGKGEVYRIYAYADKYGEGYSNPFGVDSAAVPCAATTSVIIFPKPARIELRAEKTSVLANGADNVKVTAYVYDTLGNPVADGWKINFTVGNETNNTWKGGFNWSANNGSLNSNGTQSVTNVATHDGSASVQFGWVPRGMGGYSSTIWAYYADNPNINASIKIYFTAPTASWTGYVVDSFGTGYGGVKVTLHVMGHNATASDVEIYNMTRTTSSSQPFVGLYVFDYIVLQYGDYTADYCYATANATITDNLTIRGASNNYTMNETRTSSGFIVLNIPPPDAIKLTAEKDTILVGGQDDWIIAQLYLNGLPYKRSGIDVTFSSDNDTVATLPKVKTNVTDQNGQAWILLTSNQTRGKVNVTGTAQIMFGHNLTDTTTVRVVGWGTVSGVVTDQNKNGIPNANVTLWNVKWNTTTYTRSDGSNYTVGGWENTKIVKIPENPQLSNDGRTAAIGMYTYFRVPEDVYNVTGEKDGHVYYAVFCLGSWPGDVKAYQNATEIPPCEFGTATHNIAIPDYVYISPVTPTPPVITPTPTPVVPTPTVTVKPTPGFEAAFALAGLLGVAYLIARKEN
ncbi:PGF-CTERM sorting domain-containing protein [Methanocella conradii]|uniref:PGF-CTERM sorting domain-containing protein n=1 Tax=Methanocella conradii TaxID=1175444 RepID=UPI00157BE606|nr:PGF-CTERM sorting domain-containing protein [Methanocella conradii]